MEVKIMGTLMLLFGAGIFFGEFWYHDWSKGQKK